MSKKKGTCKNLKPRRFCGGKIDNEKSGRMGHDRLYEKRAGKERPRREEGGTGAEKGQRL